MVWMTNKAEFFGALRLAWVSNGIGDDDIN